MVALFSILKLLADYAYLTRPIADQLSEARNVIQGLGDIRIISVQFFLSFILPEVQGAKVGDIITKLRSDGHIKCGW